MVILLIIVFLQFKLAVKHQRDHFVCLYLKRWRVRFLLFPSPIPFKIQNFVNSGPAQFQQVLQKIIGCRTYVLHIDFFLSKCLNERGERNTCSFRSPWVTLPLILFFPTHFVLFPSVLIGAIDGTVCPAEYPLYHVCCCLRMQIIWRAALSSSHHAMRCCHHSVSIARSRLMAEK